MRGCNDSNGNGGLERDANFSTSTLGEERRQKAWTRKGVEEAQYQLRRIDGGCTHTHTEVKRTGKRVEGREQKI